mmetsp:Transcript_25185/g.22909  ORF Transcript_25185/g.22909 Transcript_25185/m.22909 type:complete len:100 (+) Transcript_25185:557-856(+)
MNGQLGYGIFDSRTQPVKVEFPRPEKPVGICCGFRHSVVLMESGVFYVWGRSMSNVLKSRKNDDHILYNDRGVPRQLHYLENEKQLKFVDSNTYNVKCF